MITSAKFCTDTIFLASYWAPLKPELYNRISVIKTASGTTMEIDLNKVLRFIGNSDLPA